MRKLYSRMTCILQHLADALEEVGRAGKLYASSFLPGELKDLPDKFGPVFAFRVALSDQADHRGAKQHDMAREIP